MGELIWPFIVETGNYKFFILKLQIETCRKVENALKRTDRKGTLVRVLPFHAALAQESRLANMKEFMNPSRPKEESLFLVCTDRYGVCLLHELYPALSYANNQTALNPHPCIHET